MVTAITSVGLLAIRNRIRQQQYLASEGCQETVVTLNIYNRLNVI